MLKFLVILWTGSDSDPLSCTYSLLRADTELCLSVFFYAYVTNFAYNWRKKLNMMNFTSYQVLE